jgi:hypothetical protein
MKLEKGNIVYFRYNNYHKDKNPLALVLFVDKRDISGSSQKDPLVHALNLNALTPELTKDVIKVISMVIGKLLDAKDPYKFYHNTLVRKLPVALKKSYRTYKEKYIQNVVFISKGYEQGILEKLRMKYDNEKVLKTQQRIEKEISIIGSKEPDELLKQTPPAAHAFKSIDEYLNKIKEITKTKNIDMRKFTGIRRKK